MMLRLVGKSWFAIVISACLSVLLLGQYRFGDRHSVHTDYRSDLPSGSRFVTQPPQTASRRPDLTATYPGSNQRMHFTILQAFREAVGNNWMATVRILSSGRMIAMGTIVDSNGWILTKASELPSDTAEVRLHDGSRVPAKVVAQRSDVDLALLKIDRSGLQVIDWSDTDPVEVGDWIASTDLKSVPISIGVVSVANRSIKHERAVLGIGFEWTGEGNTVTMVLPGSGAWRSGLRLGDIIRSIDGKKLASRQALLDTVATMKAGQSVSLDVVRNDEDLQLRTELMDLNNTLLDPTEMEVNGEVSPRSSGFSKVIQHDTVLTPSQCGGPLVNLDGKVIGINIARAGRVSSYALPTSIVRKTLGEMMASLPGNASQGQAEIVRAQDSSVKAAP